MVKRKNIIVEMEYRVPVRRMIEYGDIKTFSQIWAIAPAQKVALELNIDPARMRSIRSGNVQLLRLEEIFKLAEYFQVLREQMVAIVLAQYHEDKKKPAP